MFLVRGSSWGRSDINILRTGLQGLLFSVHMVSSGLMSLKQKCYASKSWNICGEMLIGTPFILASYFLFSKFDIYTSSQEDSLFTTSSIFFSKKEFHSFICRLGEKRFLLGGRLQNFADFLLDGTPMFHIWWKQNF